METRKLIPLLIAAFLLGLGLGGIMDLGGSSKYAQGRLDGCNKLADVGTRGLVRCVLVKGNLHAIVANQDVEDLDHPNN